MRSMRSTEGYVRLENEHAPPVPDALIALARAAGKPVIGGSVKGVKEAPAVRCGHCHTVRLMQPLRTRERPICRGCNEYLCDGCAGVARLTGACHSLDAQFAQALEAKARGKRAAITLLRETVHV